jgi:hypothetical protein
MYNSRGVRASNQGCFLSFLVVPPRKEHCWDKSAIGYGVMGGERLLCLREEGNMFKAETCYLDMNNKSSGNREEN